MSEPAGIHADVSRYIGNENEFPVLGRWDFFNHAAVAPLSRAAASALRTFADQAETTAYLDTGWYREISALRQSIAQMIGAMKEEIAFTGNTRGGIAIAAGGIDWTADDRIVTDAFAPP